MRNGDFFQPVPIARRATDAAEADDEAPSGRVGFYYRMSEPMRESLVEMARLDAEDARKEGRKALAEHDKHKLEKRADRLQSALDVATEKFARAIELFAAWRAQRAEKIEEVDAWMHDRPEVQKLEFLRKQIEMRVIGCGWTQHATKWSSGTDERVGTVAHLREVLDEIIVEERALKRLKCLPTEAALPNFGTKAEAQLGTADEDVIEIESRALFSAEELQIKADQAVERRRAAGISDDVEDMQPLRAPAFDSSLVGKQLEVLWKYFDKSNGNKPTLIWATGR
eukprot:2802127-Prymnesium_polylepis.1